MEEFKNEQTLTTSQSAEAEENLGEQKESVSFGKFKDANSLLNAYNSLQSEFTKRCQRLKELEGELETSEKTTVPQVETRGKEEETKRDITLEEKEDILKDYLKGVLNSKAKAVVLDGVGGGVKTPPNKPKTIAEAGKIFKEILENKNN